MAQMKLSYVDLGLPELPILTDPKIEPDLRYLYMAVQNLALAVGQKLQLETPLDGFKTISDAAYTIGASKRRVYLPATEAITYGQLVNIWDNAGTCQARLANATDNTKPCFGICNTPGTCAIGAVVEIVLPEAYVSSIGGLTAGTLYYLSAATAGSGTNTPPAASGNIQQPVGLAFGAASFFFNAPYIWHTVP